MDDRRFLCAATTALTIFLCANVALADAHEDFERARTEVGFGMLAGNFQVGNVSGPGIGVHLDAGRQWGRIKLFGEYNFLLIGQDSFTNEDPVRGFLNRLGAGARYTIGEISGNRVPLQGAFWVEGGLGRQFVTWHEGGKLTRDDIALGFGAQLNVRVRRGDKPKVFGIYYAFRMVIADGPDADKMSTVPTCAGPCDGPTTPTGLDFGAFFNVGISWGR